VTNAAEALVSEFDALRADTKKQVGELKSWFQVHLQDHDINGGRPMALTGAAFYEIVKNMEGPSL
jgi:molybdenum-dependent DNA-binding transcriptional regulator ModE